jgi:hypothetical protein
MHNEGRDDVEVIAADRLMVRGFRFHVHPRGTVDRRPDARAAIARAFLFVAVAGLGTIGTQVLILHRRESLM